MATSVKADANGNVYVTGFTTSSSQDKDYLTIKYNSSGVQQWAVEYNGAANGADSAAALVLDGNNIYVTGSSYNGSNYDYLTIKYDISGVKEWEIAYNSWADGDDRASNMAIDTTGGIIVSGTSWDGSAYTYRTIKYVEEIIIDALDTIPSAMSFEFIENRGQLLSTDTSAVPFVKYYNHNFSPQTYFTDTSFSYVLQKQDTVVPYLDSVVRVDVKFFRGISPVVSGIEAKADFNNYYLSYLSSPKTRVLKYSNLLHRNIWNNIQIEYSGNARGLTYQMKVNPGGNTNDLELIFSGADSLVVDTNGYLNIYTALGIIQQEVRAWQVSPAGVKSSVAWQPAFIVTGSNVYFSLGSYTSTNSLIIAVGSPHFSASSTHQENLWWSTYHGNGGVDDWNLDIALTDANHSFIVGKTSDNLFPAINGFHVVSAGSMQNGFILHFDEYAVPEWSTIVGGANDDAIQSVVFNQALTGTDRIFFLGTTESTNIPTFPTSVSSEFVETAISGGTDALIGQVIETNGQISWLTYFGGAADDEGRSITADPLGNIFITGNTYSTVAASGCSATSNSDFPLCEPENFAYYQNFNAGGQDIFISKFNTGKVMQWSTFYGSDADDKVFQIHYSKGPSDSGADNIYMVGKTNKGTAAGSTYNCAVPANGLFPLCDDPNNVNDFHQRNAGGFISRFHLNGQLLWATNISELTALETVTDNGFYVYAVGYSTGTTLSGCTPGFGTPICNPNSGYSSNSGEMYIVKFHKLNNNIEWSTRYPGTWRHEWSLHPAEAIPDYKTMDAVSDDQDNLYIAATTSGGVSTLQSQGMYYSVNTHWGGGVHHDMALISFDETDNRNWATYFGSNALDTWDPSGSTYNTLNYSIKGEFSSALAVFEDNDLYVVGYGGGQSHPLEDPGTQPTGQAYFFSGNEGVRFDGIMSRFNLEESGVSVPDESDAIESGVLAYPNPFKEEFTISCREGIEDIIVYDIYGRKIFRASGGNAASIQINSSGWSSGYYIATLNVGGKLMQVKLVKQ